MRYLDAFTKLESNVVVKARLRIVIQPGRCKQVEVPGGNVCWPNPP